MKKQKNLHAILTVDQLVPSKTLNIGHYKGLIELEDHSNAVAFLHGSERDASTDHIVLAGVINLALPINLLDGLRWGGGVYCYLVHPFGRSVPFFFPSISQLIVGFSSVGSFA